MILHSALEHIAALWVFLADEKHREGAGMECVATVCGNTFHPCSLALFFICPATGNRKCVFSCADASPAVEWTKKQPHAIIRPEFLHVHEEVQKKTPKKNQNADGRQDRC